MNEVHIEMTGHGRGRVLVNGSDIPNVRAVRFDAEVDGPNCVRLDLVADRVKVTGPAAVRGLRAPRQLKPAPSYFEFVEARGRG